MYSLLFFIALCLFLPDRAGAANFSVNPVTLSLEAGQKTSILTIKNLSEDSLTLQLSAYAWDQDGEGKDVYLPTEEVIIFPKILSFKEGEERIIRIGTKTVPGKTEKTFRIYLEEVPEPAKPRTGGAVLRTIMKVGVPIFISPVAALPAGAIDHISLSRASLSLSIKNTGNLHFIIRGVQINGFNKAGESLFTADLKGWYLLSDRSRRYGAAIPDDICRKLDHLTIEVDTDRFRLKERREVSPAHCSP